MTATATPAVASAPQRRDWSAPRAREMAVFPGALGPTVARHARAWVVSHAQKWRVKPRGIENLELVVSELVTNAWSHTHSRSGLITVYLVQAQDGVVRVGVRDEGARHRAPTLRHPVGDDALLEGSEDATHGRGLVLVAAFSEEWSVEPNPVEPASGVSGAGHTVWACPQEAHTT